MKNIKLFIFTLAITLVGIINVNAASLSFDGDRTITGGNTGTNDIIINVGNEEIWKVEFTISTTNSALVALNVEKISSLSGSTSLSKSTLQITDGVFTSGKIATLKITNNNILNSDTTTGIKISNVVFFNKDGKEVAGSDYEKDIQLTPGATTKPKSNNPRLTNLTVSSGSLSPVFNPATTSYKVTNLKDTIKTITINAQCDNCNVQIKCELGTCTNHNNQFRPDLIVGKNILKISTISEDGSASAQYDLIIYRGETTDNSPFLASLSVEDFKLTEKFSKDILDYTLTVPNDATLLKILATAEDENATVEIKGADNLIVGENVITITVTSSETKDKKIYNITVIRLDEDEVMTTTSPVIATDNKKKNKTLFIIILSVLGITIIGLAAYFIFFKKKKNGKTELNTEEGNIELDTANTEVDIKENELIDDLNITDTMVKPTVDEALADLMITKEIILKDNSLRAE